MTREELILSDEYLQVNIDCIVVSKKSVKKIREELMEFMINYRSELLRLKKT
jgi:hypothetical protein